MVLKKELNYTIKIKQIIKSIEKKKKVILVMKTTAMQFCFMISNNITNLNVHYKLKFILPLVEIYSTLSKKDVR